MDRSESRARESIKLIIAKHYDRESGIYDESRFKTSTWYRRIDEETCKVLNMYLKGKTVLELGAGTGRYGIFCSKRGFQWLGIDISSGMINKARENFNKYGLNLSIIQGDVEDERLYPENYYDNVICVKSFAFFPNPKIVIKNVFKTLRNGGRFIVVTANNDSLYARIKRPKSDLMNFYSFRDMKNC